MIERINILAIQLQHLAELAFGFRKLSRIQQDRSESVVGRQEIRLGANRQAQMSGCLRGLVLLQQSKRQVVLSFPGMRVHPNGRLECSHRA